MSNKIVLRQEPSSNRRQPLLKSQSSKAGNTVGELVGSTTAECVAVCCCCPCAVLNLLVLAIYKIPAGLCRKMLKRRRRRRVIKEGLLQPKRGRCSCGCSDDPRTHPTCVKDASDIKRVELDKDALALEKEMWDRFYSTGFWRSSSRRESSQTLPNSYIVPNPKHLETVVYRA
ncbi:uncharacterized protein LOC133314661 [Gastrolobium bilobum]|uniref:uncharacterized protein LOC133314661 n=1 Tax=Gastrolobium bilobum TaxID=150636 RepID=UPI002AB17256|nr:uncharacterized protein LOC133314661 [Gastrolobium bilobum]